MTNTILLLTAILSLSACATDDEPYRTGNPGRPDTKPELGDTRPSSVPDASTGIDESIDPDTTIVLDPRKDDVDLTLDGRIGEWAEDILLDGKQLTVIHHGLDYAELVDGDLVINPHYDPRQ